MLGKLIKHDFRSLSRILIPTQLVILGATIIATAAFSFNIKSEQGGPIMGSTGFEILQIISIFMGGMMLLAIIAASFLVGFIIFYRFYKSFMCDEGYLTFTLPVKTTHLLWSKLITAMIWCFISSVVIFISLNIFILFGTSQRGILNLEVYRSIGSFIKMTVNTIGGGLTLHLIEFIFLVILSTAFSILHVYLALIIGGVVTHKHKLLAGIGFYFAINIVVGILSTVGQFLLTPVVMNNFNEFETYNNLQPAQIIANIIADTQPFFLLYIGLTGVFTVAFFLVSNYLLKNRLNLE